MADLIHIEALELFACVGVGAEERAAPQRLTVNLTLESRKNFRELGDRIENAVDYLEVSRAVQALASACSYHLLETLAQRIAEEVLGGFPVRAAEVELRKYILPDTAFVAVRVRHER